jgi:hypothetical protein
MKHEHFPRFVKRLAKHLLVAASLALGVWSCGGGDDHELTLLTYSGTVSGTNCLAGFPESATVRYAVRIDDLSAGSGVTLQDQNGLTWSGTMTSPSSFTVTSPTSDPQMSIVVSDIAPTGAHVVATTSCVSFRCCTALTGDVGN